MLVDVLDVVQRTSKGLDQKAERVDFKIKGTTIQSIVTTHLSQPQRERLEGILKPLRTPSSAPADSSKPLWPSQTSAPLARSISP
ncbi:MAG: hypothetical protein WCL48_09835 [Betaproteobacteria bacterium]